MIDNPAPVVMLMRLYIYAKLNNTAANIRTFLYTLSCQTTTSRNFFFGSLLII